MLHGGRDEVDHSLGLYLRCKGTIACIALCLLLSLLPTSLFAQSQASGVAANTDLTPTANASVRGTLRRYRAAGYAIVFSNSVVRRSLRFGPTLSVPATLDPIDQLRQALAPLRLQLSERADGRFYVVPMHQLPAAVRNGEQVAPPPTDPEIEVPTLEELVVTSSRYRIKSKDSASPSFRRLQENELNRLPDLGDDALRAALHLPGMAGVGVSAKPYVRGGGQDEILVLFDSVPLFEPYHLRDFQSIFSSLNPAVIDSIDVYTGGFPARYGDRLSAVIDIKPRGGHQHFGGDLLLSVLTASTSLHGPLARGRGDWTLSARRGNLDWVTRQVNPSAGDPAYSDWLGQFTLALAPRWDLSSSLVAYEDDVRLTDGEADDGEDALSRYQNWYGWVSINGQLGSNVESSTVLNFNRIKHDRSGRIVDDDLADSNANVDDRRQFRTLGVNQRFSFQRAPGRGWELGFTLNHQRGRYNYRALIDRAELAELLGTETTINRNIQLSPKGFSGAAFASQYLKPFASLSLELGLRYDFQRYGNLRERQLSPRFSAKQALGERTDLRISAGRFYQADGIHELQVVDGLTDYQRPQRADHYIVSLEHRLSESNVAIRAELFYKRFSQSKQRFENLFNRFVLLPELAADRISLDPQRARAYGIEFSVAHNRGEQWLNWFSYGYARAEDDIDGRWTVRSWDQRHSVSMGTAWQGERWEFSASLLAHSGWPTSRLPTTLRPQEQLQVRRNNARLSNFASLDLRVARHWRRGDQSIRVFAELTNALTRDNAGAVEVDIDSLEDDAGLVFTTTEEPVFPWIPSIGIHWTF